MSCRSQVSVPLDYNGVQQTKEGATGPDVVAVIEVSARNTTRFFERKRPDNGAVNSFDRKPG